MNFAVRRKHIRENPLAELKLVAPKSTPQPYWPREQVETILAAASPGYRSLFHFLADTGTRIGETSWLTWDDVDLDNAMVHIRAKEGWQPKNGDQRSVQLSTGLCETLRTLPKKCKWVFTAPTTSEYPRADRQVSARRALAHLKVVLKKQGLKGHLHTFRHSFISHALTSGVAPAIVRTWVGHVDEEILKVYTHIADQQSRAAMDRMLPGVADHRGGEHADDGGLERAQNVRRKED